MGVLVDNLLSLARLDEGRPLELVDVDLTALAGDAVNDARAVEPDRPITLVAADRARRRRRNARCGRCSRTCWRTLASTRRHGTAVEVRVDDTRPERRIDVVDDGAGIDAERA